MWGLKPNSFLKTKSYSPLPLQSFIDYDLDRRFDKNYYWRYWAS